MISIGPFLRGLPEEISTSKPKILKEGCCTVGNYPKSCPIPVADDPNKIVIPEKRTPEKLVQRLSYITEDSNATNGSQSSPLFAAKSFSLSLWWPSDLAAKRGKLQNQAEHEEKLDSNKWQLSFMVKNGKEKVHCGFMQGGGEEMAPKDIEYVKKCKFVVATGIFDDYDSPHQPSNISKRSESLFCFLMVVDEVSLKFIRNNVSVTEDIHGGQWVGIWRLILLKHQPYDEPRRNGKVPKILTHRLFPQAQYSIWIDGKMELIVDPLLLLERYLWRGKYTFAIAQHKHHRNIYEEADSNKRRKRYARPLIDLHMKIYRYEGLEPWSQQKGTLSDVPEGAIIIREHTALNNLFSCLWFNEVHLFTPRDQLSFGYVVYRLGGLWTPYPGNLDLVVMPPVARTSKAG
ncbi:hypothetical protein DH2020_014273 [Rehmannia glutinosa]|uniref:TOD1/MUCI70 glycosyltransferase-like domain-containing protein n=1 Tax=Rehmannia glutinosa TaxID=99300 RepID=A0ABR0WXF3_REHGL